jgi:hypothetical protein
VAVDVVEVTAVVVVLVMVVVEALSRRCPEAVT